jgi:ketosteroid isomerase-like protein
MDVNLQRLLDEDAIRRITAFYSDAVSRLDAARAASIYTEDGEVEIVGTITVGRATIEEGMRQSFSAFDVLQLVAHGGVIDLDGNQARACWSTVELGIRRGSQSLNVILGRYDDVLVRKTEGWRFLRRTFTLAGRTQLDTTKLQLNPSFFSSVLAGVHRL